MTHATTMLIVVSLYYGQASPPAPQPDIYTHFNGRTSHCPSGLLFIELFKKNELLNFGRLLGPPYGAPM